MSVCCGVGPIVDVVNSGNVSVHGGVSATSGDTRPAMNSHCRGGSVLPVPCSLLSWGQREDLFPLPGGVSCSIPALH